MELSGSDPSIEYRGRPAQADRAAAYVLRKIAERRGLLHETLSKLGMLSADTGTDEHKPLREALPRDFMVTVMGATGLPADQLEQPLLDQLDRVAQFAKSDGVFSDENVKAAEYLILSGREALFAR